MPNLDEVFREGVQYQLKRVLILLGEDRIDKGLTAFEDGASSWANCFFARAFAGELNLCNGDPETQICRTLGLFNTAGRPNKVPVRILYTMFDQLQGSAMTKRELYEFISHVRDETRPNEVRDLLASLDFTGAEDKELQLVCL